MRAYVARRLLYALPVLFAAATLTFFLIHLVPGDPVDAMLGPQASSEDRAHLTHELGLDRPLADQYVDYLTRLLHGDLGRSLVSRLPVASELLARVPATIELATVALAWALLIGIPLGVIAAVRRGSKTEAALVTGGLLGISLPSFWIAPMLMWFFAIKLDWLPVSERAGLLSIVLPSLSLGLAMAAILLRMTRASMLDVIGEDYIRSAQAKGLAPSKVYFKHALRNALTPIITLVGLQLGALLTGTVVIETIFDWPGVGSLFFQAIQQRNYPMVQGCVLFISTVYVLVNLATDLSYAVANPKVRLS